MQYLGYTLTKNVFLVYLKIQVQQVVWQPYFLLPTLGRLIVLIIYLSPAIPNLVLLHLQFGNREGFHFQFGYRRTCKTFVHVIKSEIRQTYE